MVSLYEHESLCDASDGLAILVVVLRTCPKQMAGPKHVIFSDVQFTRAGRRNGTRDFEALNSNIAMF